MNFYENLITVDLCICDFYMQPGTSNVAENFVQVKPLRRHSATTILRYIRYNCKVIHFPQKRPNASTLAFEKNLPA